MSRIFIPSRKNIIIISTVIFIVLFIGGFLLGNKYGEVIPVINHKLVPIYKVNRNDQKIAITLDGTWGAEHTEKLLGIFKENDVKITFFFAGYWLKKYPDLVKKIAADGHEIGNHTFTHPHCNSLSREKLSKELEDTSKLIKKLIGSSSSYFRAPYGEYNNRVIQTANELGYQVIQWSIDSHDWKEPGVGYIVNRVINNVESGDIILMHNNAPDTPDALRILLPRLKEMGYSIVPLSNMVYKDNYYIESHSGLQCKRTGRSD